MQAAIRALEPPPDLRVRYPNAFWATEAEHHEEIRRVKALAERLAKL